MLILGSLSQFTYTDCNDYFLKLIIQSNLFHFDNDKREMKKLINTLVLTYKYCQSMRMTGKARPSETEAAKRSEVSASVIPVEETKEEEKTLMLSSALSELVIVCKVETFQLRMGLKRKMKMKLRHRRRRVEKKVIETASDLGVSGKEVEPGEKEQPEKDATEALLVLEKIQIEEKISFEYVKMTESEQDVGEE